MLGIFLDLEATGLDPQRHRVIQLAMKGLDLTEQKELFSYETIVKQPYEVWQRRDSFSVTVNGFHFEDVEKGKEEADVGLDIVQIFKEHRVKRGESVYICQNPAFDRSFFAQIIDLYTQERMQWPYHWLDLASMYWAFSCEAAIKQQKKIPKEFSFSKDSIAKTYGLPPEEKPHKAMQGVDHLILCYQALFQALPQKIS